MTTLKELHETIANVIAIDELSVNPSKGEKPTIVHGPNNKIPNKSNIVHGPGGNKGGDIKPLGMGKKYKEYNKDLKELHNTIANVIGNVEEGVMVTYHKPGVSSKEHEDASTLDGTSGDSDTRTIDLPHGHFPDSHTTLKAAGWKPKSTRSYDDSRQARRMGPLSK